MNLTPRVNRRAFLKDASAVCAAPMIVPSSVLGANPPSERISIGRIEYGRQTHHRNLPQLLKPPYAYAVARRVPSLAAFVRKRDIDRGRRF